MSRRQQRSYTEKIETSVRLRREAHDALWSIASSERTTKTSILERAIDRFNKEVALRPEQLRARMQQRHAVTSRLSPSVN